MKKSFLLLGAAIAVIAALSGCNKENEVTTPVDEPQGEDIQLTITALGDEETKTHLENDGSVLWNATGEYLAVLEKSSAENLTSKKSAQGVAGSNNTMNFGVTLSAATGYDGEDPGDSNKYFDYYTVYPFDAFVDGKYTDATAIKVNLSQDQKPTSTSFGPAAASSADILISKPVVGETAQPTTLNLYYKRIVSIGKMTIKNVDSDEDVVSVKFTSKNQVVAGRSYVNLSTGTVTEYGYNNTGVDHVTLDYSAESIAANSNFVAYFAVWPFSISGPDSGDPATDDNKFIVEVKTATKTFTKEVTIPTGRSLTFNEGKATKFSVDFDGITGTTSGVNLANATLTFSEISDDGANDGNGSWGTYTQEYEYTQSNGANWIVRCYYNENYIQLGNCTASSGAKNSYIKLPDFTDNILTVTVTLNSALYSDKTLFLASSATSTTGDLQSYTGDGSTSVYTFNISTSSVKTAYLRTTATAQVLSVAVTAGEDTRTKLAAPATVLADVNSTTSNAIDVTWSTVTNAGSYIVICAPTSGEPVSKTVTGQSSEETTVTGLDYSTSYTVSVYAVPSNTELYLDSDPTEADQQVVTGAAPALSRGATWSYTFDAKVWSADGNQTINEKTWSMSGTGGTYFGYDATKGQQFGSGTYPYSVVTLSSNFGVSYGIDEIRVSTSGAKDISATVSVSVGGTAFECESSTTATLTSTNTVYTFVSPDGNIKAGDIQISYSNSSSKAIFIKKIVVNPAAATQLTMSDIKCTAHTSSSLTFGWSAVDGAVGYQVSTDGSTFGETQSATSYTLSGLKAETNYYIWVKAIGDGVEYTTSEAKKSAVGTTDATSGGGTSTLTFTAKCNGSGTADDGAEWTVTSDGAESNFDSTSGIHYGTNNAAVTYVQLATSDITGTTTQVVVNARDAQATATISVTVGGSTFTCSGSPTATNTSTNYTFTGSGSGEIVVRVDRGSSMKKAIYVKSVVVTYE